ncbi:hypothetical protein D3C71_25320 [compost metagenome]
MNQSHTHTAETVQEVSASVGPEGHPIVVPEGTLCKKLVEGRWVVFEGQLHLAPEEHCERAIAHVEQFGISVDPEHLTKVQEVVRLA